MTDARQEWEQRAIAKGHTDVADRARDRAIKAGEKLPGYVERTVNGQQYYMRRLNNGEYEGYKKKVERPKLGDQKAWIPASANTMEKFPIAELETIEISEIEDITTGIIGSGVVIGGLRPHANKPGEWRILSHRTATLDRKFSSIAWPHPQLLSVMLMSASAREDISGGSFSEVGEIITDTPTGGDLGQTVIRDDGFSIDPDAVAQNRLTSPIASVLLDEVNKDAGWSLELVAVCDHEGLTNLNAHLLEVAGNPDNRMSFSGIRWSGMMRHDLQLGEVDIYKPALDRYSTLTLRRFPDPLTFIQGHPDRDPAFNSGDVPAVAVIDILVLWNEYNSPVSGQKLWDKTVLATRRN